ncbi:MBL fold metallo-hydrolase [Nakamurella sp.]|uniref:MBL fold metallo-hydrolase n=1 Tax=Nakamurella sp. TaxID=1869182 RepID=UPI003B3A458E
MCDNPAVHDQIHEGAGGELVVPAASRRTILKSALAIGGATLAAGALGTAAAGAAYADSGSAGSSRPVTGDRIVMLGVNGGPVADPGTTKPAIALVAGTGTYLIDSGLDTARQLVDCGLGYAAMSNVFITHHHFDHTSGLPGLVMHGWVSRKLPTLNIWGPPDTAAKLAGIKQTFNQDINTFLSGGGFGPFPTVNTTDIAVPADGTPTRVMEDANVVVDATRVFHGPEVANAYAYRFTIKSTGKVVVFSGDTAAPDQNLINLAKNCDVLVHETQNNLKVDQIAASLPPAQGDALRKHLYESHSNVVDLPGVAKAANAKKLVFCHYTPDYTDRPQVYLSQARPAARKVGYRGDIIAPSALDVIRL